MNNKKTEIAVDTRKDEDITVKNKNDQEIAVDTRNDQEIAEGYQVEGNAVVTMVGDLCGSQLR